MLYSLGKAEELRCFTECSKRIVFLKAADLSFSLNYRFLQYKRSRHENKMCFCLLKSREHKTANKINVLCTNDLLLPLTP